MRVLLKSLSYRTVSLVASIAVAGAVTGNLETAIEVGLWGSLVKIGLFIAHEKAWESVVEVETAETPAAVTGESIWSLA